MRFDALIIGGGPAGSAAAIALRQAGYSACVADAGDGGDFKAGESLPSAVKPLLRRLDALSACEGETALISYGNQSAWGSSMLWTTDFIHDPNGAGWHIDRIRFDVALREIARERGAMIFERSRAQRFERLTNGEWAARLRDADGRITQVSARFIVDCSGRTAFFAQSQGARRRLHDRLAAVIGIFDASSDSHDEDSRTLVESVADGWWYTSLIPGNRRIAAFHTDASTEELRAARLPERFEALLGETEHVREKIKSHNWRLAGPLRFSAAGAGILNRLTGPGWIAAGDAALSLDPLSSQGILTALYSGVKTAEAIDQSLNGNKDALTEYETNLRGVFDICLRRLEPVYRAENRWPENPFWRSRQESGVRKFAADSLDEQ